MSDKCLKQNHYFIKFILLILPLLYSCSSESEKQLWHKGNLHTHSFWSDGDDFPEMIIKWYKDHEYQFIALSDHNTIADSDFWYKLTQKDIKNKVLDQYIETFGDEWVERKKEFEDTYVKLKTFDQYKSKLEEENAFKIIRSEEVTSSFNKKPIHINVTNIDKKIDPVKGTSVLDVMQRTLDLVNEQREKLGIPIFAHINHPNFGYGISTEDLKKLNGERFFEIYNGHPAVNNGGNEIYDSTELMWDLVNIHYYKQGKPLLLGIATDDSHNYHDYSPNHSNTGRGWVMVNAKNLEISTLIEAMEKGNFYASTGVYLKKLRSSNKEIFIEVEPEANTSYEIEFLGYQKGNDQLNVLKKVNGITAEYSFGKADVFVRAKITATNTLKKEPLLEGSMQAWTQPMLIE